MLAEQLNQGPIRGVTDPQMSPLEKLLSPLDWGRQALVNVGQGFGDIGEGNILHGLLRMAPAALGLGAGLLTGGVAAPLVGTGVASFLQGIGNDWNPKIHAAMTTADLVEKLGGDRESTIHNLAVGALTDPWTYALGAGGLRLGAKAGEVLGARVGEAAGKGLLSGEQYVKNLASGVEEAALLRGPRYGTKVGELLDTIGSHPGEPSILPKGELGPFVSQDNGLSTFLRRNPKTAEMLANEVPKGSSIDYPGKSGIARFTSPKGQEVRIGMTGDIAGMTSSPAQDSIRSAIAFEEGLPHPGIGDKFATIQHGPYSPQPQNIVSLDGVTGNVPTSPFHQRLAELLGSDKQLQSRLARGLPGAGYAFADTPWFGADLPGRLSDVGKLLGSIGGSGSGGALGLALGGNVGRLPRSLVDYAPKKKHIAGLGGLDDGTQ